MLTSSLQTYGANLAAALLSLANVLVVARVLGPTGRGEVAFLTAIAWLTSNLATLGVEEANANIGAAAPRARPALATNAVLLAIVSGGIAIAVLAGLIALVPAVGGHSDPVLLWLTFGSLPILIAQISLRLLVLAKYRFTLSNAAFLLPYVVNVVANGLFAALGWLRVGTAVGSWIAGQLLATMLLAWYIARRGEGFGRPDAALARASLGFGLKSHAGRIMLLGNYRLDQWLLGAIAGARPLGVYSIAVAWSEALWYLPTALSAVQRPDLVRASRSEAARSAAFVFRAAALATAAAALAMFVLAPFLCVTIFGNRFHGAIVDLRVLIIGSLGIVALKQLGNALTAQGRPLLTSAANSFAFLVTVGLDVALIPAHADLGASIASALGYSVGGFVMALLFARALEAKLADLVPRSGDFAFLWASARRGSRRSSAAAP
jgi:O-antigen/teichoic acid export membrane protein